MLTAALELTKANMWSTSQAPSGHLPSTLSINLCLSVIKKWNDILTGCCQIELARWTINDKGHYHRY